MLTNGNERAKIYVECLFHIVHANVNLYIIHRVNKIKYHE
jgi:hypothetical protein